MARSSRLRRAAERGRCWAGWRSIRGCTRAVSSPRPCGQTSWIRARYRVCAAHCGRCDVRWVRRRLLWLPIVSDLDSKPGRLPLTCWSSRRWRRPGSSSGRTRCGAGRCWQVSTRTGRFGRATRRLNAWGRCSRRSRSRRPRPAICRAPCIGPAGGRPWTRSRRKARGWSCAAWPNPATGRRRWPSTTVCAAAPAGTRAGAVERDTGAGARAPPRTACRTRAGPGVRDRRAAAPAAPAGRPRRRARPPAAAVGRGETGIRWRRDRRGPGGDRQDAAAGRADRDRCRD